MSWTATRKELAEDFNRMHIAHNLLGPVECNHRIAFHDKDQEAVKVITPAPRFIAALMAGNYIRNIRVIGQDEETGAPILDGTGKLMGPMTYEEAVLFVIWKDMPVGVNNYEILTTDDLPRIRGDIDLARKFRSAWRLENKDV